MTLKTTYPNQIEIAHRANSPIQCLLSFFFLFILRSNIVFGRFALTVPSESIVFRDKERALRNRHHCFPIENT